MAKIVPLSTPEPPAGVDFSRFKIPPIPIPADTCRIVKDRVIENGEVVGEGTAYEPHLGESVWIFRTDNYDSYLKLMALGDIGDTSDVREIARRLEQQLSELVGILARHVVAWNWTDNEREPLPQPYKHPEVLRDLENDELLWLIGIVRDGSPREKKTDGAPSDDSSTVTDPPREG